MKKTIYITFAIILFASCKQNNKKEILSETFTDTKIKTVVKDTVFTLTQQPKGVEHTKEIEEIDPEKLVGRYRMWNKENDCYSIAEISKDKNKYVVIFYLEIYKEGGFGDVLEIKEGLLYMKPNGDYNGCTIRLEKGKLAVKWNDSKDIEYYLKF